MCIQCLGMKTWLKLSDLHGVITHVIECGTWEERFLTFLKAHVESRKLERLTLLIHPCDLEILKQVSRERGIGIYLKWTYK